MLLLLLRCTVAPRPTAAGDPILPYVEKFIGWIRDDDIDASMHRVVQMYRFYGGEEIIIRSALLN